MLDSLTTMQADLNSAEQAMTKIWAKRQTQIDRVAKSMLTVVGELPAISQNPLPTPDGIEALALTANITEGDEE